ncbi:porin family protein [Brevundimonas sp.]|uniref:outer membrane protein n=1 Tax=Brevundimonas sp. TaxID=1871086 RepID=UPI00263232B9|nr:porin family protein [Brevundimonas sp.]
MKTTTTFAAAAIALLAAADARAQDQHFSGAHVSAGVSYADVSVDQPLYLAPGRLKASDSGASYRFAAGYDWQFGGLVVGGELGTRFGGSDVSARVGGVNAEASSGSWDYSVRAGAVLGERTLVYGRVGGARTRLRQSITPVGATTAQRKTETADGLMYGVGVEYALSDDWAVRGEWSRVEGESDSRRSDYTLSAVFRF